MIWVKNWYHSLIILLVLILGVALKMGLREESQDIAEELGVTKILPEDFLIADVTRMEIYFGKKDKEKIEVSQTAEGWKLESAYRAPGNEETIKKFLGTLKDLQGELRSSSADVLGDFQVNEQQALHIKLTRKDKKQTHLLVGKKDGYSACFLRRAGENDVYRVGKQLRSEVGIWGESDKAPENSVWLDKKIWKLKKEEISKITVQYPDKQFSVVRVEKKKPKKEKTEEKKKAEPAKPEKKEYEWRLASGGIGRKIKKKELESLIDTISSLDAVDVVDPKQKQKWGLSKPGFQLTVNLEDGSKKVLFGGLPTIDLDGYCYVQENSELVYKVGNYNFTKTLFKPGGKFFSLPGLNLPKNQAKQFELLTPEGKITLEHLSKQDGDKKDFSWNLISADSTLEVNKYAAADIVNKLSSLKPVDYTDETNPALFGLAKPAYRLVVDMKDGTQHTIKAGNPSACVDGRYVQWDKQKMIGVVAKYELETLFPAFDKLFKLEMVNLDIDEFTLAREKDSFSLKKTGAAWQIIVAGKTTQAKKDHVDKLCEHFKPLKAKSVSFRSDIVKGQKPVATVMVGAKGKRSTLSIYALQNGKYPVKLADKKDLYLLEQAMGDNILNKTAAYFQKEQKPQIPVKKAETEKKQDPQQKTETEKKQDPQQKTETEKKQDPQQKTETEKKQDPQQKTETEKKQDPQQKTETEKKQDPQQKN